MNEWNSREKPYGRQWNILLDSVVTILKYKKGTIDHDIYIKVFSNGKVYYLIVSTDGVIKKPINRQHLLN